MPLDAAQVRALCFDVDGTLRDTDDQYVARLAGYLEMVKFMLPGQETKTIARRAIMSFEDPGNLILGLADRLGIDNLVARLLYAIEKPRTRKNVKIPVIPGVSEMLGLLDKRYPMAIVSTRGHGATLDFLESNHLAGFFQVVVSGQTCKRTKPHPMPVQWAAEKLGVPPQACLMVGDTKVDIRAGRAAGAQTVGVLCGFGTEDELLKAGAQLILKSTPDLVGYLLHNG
jgi:HAD superfamily hydrolase (TIGR01509 family)